LNKKGGIIMSELDELKKTNKLEHEQMRKQMKNIGLVNKVLLTILIAVFVVTLKVLLSINYYAERSYNFRVQTYITVQTILKRTANSEKKIDRIYQAEIHPNTLRSKKDSIDLQKIKHIIGIY